MNSQNIYATIYATNVDVIGLPKMEWIHSLKSSIEKTFLQLLPQEEMGILEGMIIGDTSYISDETKEYFRNCGISHLLAVSGSNVAYVLVLCQFLFKKFFGRNTSHIFTSGFIIIFTILSGGSASVVRATIMAIFVIGAELFAQKPNVYASISGAALLILLYNPLIIFDIGFILSFGGTIGIVLLSKKINTVIQSKVSKYFSLSDENKISVKLANLLIETLSVTLSAQIIVTPITLYFFNTFSMVSVIVNLIVVPITGFVTILGIVMYFISLFCMPAARILSYVLYAIIAFVIRVSALFARLPFANLLLPTPSILFIMTYYFAVYVVFYGKGGQRNTLPLQRRIIIAMVSVLMISSLIPYNHINVNMVDVGQGDCVFIETPHKKTILVDTGGTEGSNYDVGENILVPYLLDRGKLKVDCVFISHMHEDHAEGLLTVMEKLKVGKIIINEQKQDTELYQSICDKAKEKRIEIMIVKEGDKIVIDGVTFQMLLSKETMTNNLNNTSLVLKMIYGEISMLLTGDAEKEVEEYAESNVKSTILKVPHHGSTTSSTEEFLKKVSPQIAIIGVGVNNRFGHPKQEVIERLERMHINIFRTDCNGEIYMKLYKSGKMKIDTVLN